MKRDISNSQRISTNHKIGGAGLRTARRNTHTPLNETQQPCSPKERRKKIKEKQMIFPAYHVFHRNKKSAASPLLGGAQFVGSQSVIPVPF